MTHRERLGICQTQRAITAMNTTILVMASVRAPPGMVDATAGLLSVIVITYRAIEAIQ